MIGAPGGAAYSIIGVFSVRGKAENVTERGRTHTSLSLRIRGNSTFNTSEKKLFAGDGSIVYIPAGIDYRRETSSNEQLLVIHLKTYCESENEIRVFDGCADTRQIFETLLREWENGGKESLNRCMSLLYSIFDSVQKSHDLPTSSPPNAIDAGVRMLENHFRAPDITVSDMAKKCHISETYFRKLYKQYFGITPMQALLEKRFKYAESLLLSGYYTVKEVADMSGFSDVKYFRTAFRKHIGATPTQFKNTKKSLK